ncbi:MAG TPA: DUF2202 domain-containing protein [Anaerolineales bacterium]|nr:DUF2202 domain-containing protein [Anaerolineales bacterium]
MCKKTKSQLMAMLVLGLLVFGAIFNLQAIPVVSAGSLDPSEEESLLFVREEEKMARDTYLTLYGKWGLNPFSGISNSEQHHMDAILNLLNKYGIPDPASHQIGDFKNTVLQGYYDWLIAWGLQSKTDAFLVGCYVEELDILDLTTRLQTIDNTDIRNVFQNLISGSENHLRAYVSNYERISGETYEPVLLDQAYYDQIISGSSGCGWTGRRH